MNPTWIVRVGRTRPQTFTVRTRAHGFDVGPSLDFGATNAAPAALEAFLGTVAADLLSHFTDLCHRRRLPIDQIEARIDGTLGNALVALNVVGETGDPGLESIVISVSVTSPSKDSLLRAAWDEALLRAPLLVTLRRATSLTTELRIL
jgi:hypothetical protein